VKILQPLAIRDVTLAARNVLDMPGVDQTDLEPMRFEHLKSRDPINTCAFHGYGLDVTLLQPSSKVLQIGREHFKAPNRLICTVMRYSNVQLSGPDIYASRIFPQDRKRSRGL
jgi:hypothetical protein